MMQKVLVVLVGAMLALSFTACKKKEESPIVGPGGGHGTPGVMMPQGPSQVIIPESVAGQWKAIMITIEDKDTQKAQDITIDLNTEYSVPDSTLKIKAGDFLPDFKMEGSVITSASVETKNPAAHITVFDGDEEIFAGWLFLKFPAIHPFQHEKYGITLKEGIKQG